MGEVKMRQLAVDSAEKVPGPGSIARGTRSGKGRRRAGRARRCLRAASALAVLLVGAPALGQQSVTASAPTSAVLGDQTEPSIAIDPNDSNRMLVGAIEVSVKGCRYYQTENGGQSWTTDLIDPAPRARCTDPSVDFASDGSAYFAGLFYDGDFVDTRLGVASSDDGGKTFGAPTLIDDVWNQGSPPFGVPGPVVEVDKPYIAVDKTGGATDGTIHLVWNTTPFIRDAASCGDTDGNGTLDVCARHIRHASSTDGGATFGSQGYISQSLGLTNNFAAHPAVGPDGRLYIAWRRFHVRQGNGVWAPSDAIVVYRGPPVSTFITAVDLGVQAASAGVQGTLRTTRYPIVGVSQLGSTAGHVYVAFADDSLEYQDVTPAGGTQPRVTDATVGGRLVGYFDDAGTVVGFVSDRGEVRPVRVTDALETIPRGINDRNEIVGTFKDQAGTEHGFRLDGNGFSTTPGFLPSTLYDAPGAVATRLTGINNRGDVVGSFTTGASVVRGFIVDANGFRIIDEPNATRTEARDVNDEGVVVGVLLDQTGVRRGFITDDGANFTLFDHPNGEVQDVAAVNDDRHVFGHYEDAGGALKGFRWDGSSFVPVDVPGAVDTLPEGVSSSGEVVGGYAPSTGGIRGFRSSGVPSQDVWISASIDDGLNWSEPRRVNDRVAGDQFDPWMCVGPDGLISTLR